MVEETNETAANGFFQKSIDNNISAPLSTLNSPLIGQMGEKYPNIISLQQWNQRTYIYTSLP